jgi:peptidoglycan/xylan/chitin deacetylase (PgdA/CDA1 family)
MVIESANLNLYNGQALVSLTYDDGQKNNFEVALPLHLEFNLPAGFAVIAQRTQESRYWKRYMEAWQVTEASRRGIEIYSHSYSHPRLTEVDDETLAFELEKSRELLERLIDTDRQKEVTSLAIPFSAANGHVLSEAKKYYSHIRVKENRTTPVLPAPEAVSLVYSFGLAQGTTFDDVRTLIDQAVREKSWLTLMLHGVVPESSPAMRFNDIDAGLLRKIAGYIQIVGPESILPINLSDINGIRSHRLELQLSTAAQEYAQVPILSPRSA